MYTLTRAGVDDTALVGDLEISAPLTIQGAGPDKTVVDGNGAATHDRVFHILSTAEQTSLSGMTIHIGVAETTTMATDAFKGGGIYQDSYDFNLTDVIIEGNRADVGGGLYHYFNVNIGTVNLEHVTVRDNHVLQYGGGIYVQGLAGGTIILTSLYTIRDSTISGNTASEGGGITFVGSGNSQSVLDITNSTISGNGVSIAGGGLEDSNGVVNLSNVTIAGNRLFPALGAVGGAGIYTFHLPMYSATVNMKNTLIGYNLRRTGVIQFDQDDCYGSPTSFGHNLIQSTTNCTVTGTFAIGDLTGIDPQLSPLGNNGGPTQTQALLKGSPAIEAGNPLGCTDFNLAALTTDQRGYVRPIGGRCDISAYEYYLDTLFLPTILK